METQKIPHFFSIHMPKELWPTFTEYLNEKIIESESLIDEIKQAYHFYTETLQKIRLLK
ncbi:hypothetical protein [Rhizosphaericola mali]|uniref:hypothetical protein n=1 Tax=Rhizosphaericola mali TaxID=2545455 RepID=UPI001785676B|nr:hypothetical protein [Rhizosphaericola mali]